MKERGTCDGHLFIVGALLLAAGVAMGDTLHIIIGLAAGLACLALSSLLRRRTKLGSIQRQQHYDAAKEVQVTYWYPRQISRGECQTITITLCNRSQRYWPSPRIFFADLRRWPTNSEGDTLPISTAVLPPLGPGEKHSTDIQFLGLGKQVQTRFWIVAESSGRDQMSANLEFDVCIEVQATENETVLIGEQVR